MSQLDQIVSVSVTSASSPVKQAAFSVPLIMGATVPGWTDGAKLHTYTDPSGMLTDGYTLTSPEYIEALALYSGQVAPSSFFVAPRSTASAAQIDTFLAPAVAAGNVFSFKIGSTTCSYTAQTSDTDQQVMTALATQATATGLVTSLISNSGSNKLLTLTGATTGVAVAYSAITSNLTHTQTQASAGIASDLAAAAGASTGWYALRTPGVTPTDALQAAAWVEANKKIYFPQIPDPAVLTTGTTDVAAKLFALGYVRTFPVYNGQNGNTAAAWIGTNLPAIPGSNNWNLTTLPGQAPDTLTDTQVANAFAKNVNLYQNIGGVSVMRYGTSSSGQFVDTRIGLDWLQATIQTNIYQILVDAAALGKKIPYTDVGSAQVAQGVRMAIAQAIRNGFIDPAQPYSVSTTSVASTPTAQRAKRICPTITFTAKLAGAINTVTVNGTVSV